MTQRNRPIGYDVELEDESLYLQRPRTSTMRYRPVETRDIPQQRAVTRRPPQQGVRKPNQYDNVNVYVRRRSSQAPSRTQHASQPERQRVPVQDDTETATEPLRPSSNSQHPHTPRFH